MKPEKPTHQYAAHR